MHASSGKHAWLVPVMSLFDAVATVGWAMKDERFELHKRTILVDAILKK